MNVKTAFLNGDLEEVYMKQPKRFIMPGNEQKVCKLVKSLYGLKQAPKQWHQKFDEVVLSSGFLLNQSEKCVYSKFDRFGKGVIICLYVDDKLIFDTNQNQVDKTKKFLSSGFSIKDMGKADVILGCSLVSTPMDPVEKLKPNKGKLVDLLEYSRAIGCLMYAMTSTRPDIAYVVGRLSRFTSNPSRQHWQAITKWRVFLLEGGVISWAFKKQTCIIGSTMESEFVALAAAGAPNPITHSSPQWIPPHESLVKINCDAAFKDSKAAYAYNQGWCGAIVESDSQTAISLSPSEAIAPWSLASEERTKIRMMESVSIGKWLTDSRRPSLNEDLNILAGTS
nr:hypothetical protein [Tanacetum cinerariifolium]